MGFCTSLVQDQARAELEGVTFVGRADLGAPHHASLSLRFTHTAITALDSHIQAKGTATKTRIDCLVAAVAYILHVHRPAVGSGSAVFNSGARFGPTLLCFCPLTFMYWYTALADCIISGGKVVVGAEQEGASGQFENCHVSGSFLGDAGMCVVGKTHVQLRSCTVQVSGRAL
jgi:hypothetical protein